MKDLPQHGAAPALEGPSAGQYLRSLKLTLIAVTVLSAVRGVLQAGAPHHLEDAALVLLLKNTSPAASLLRSLYEWPWLLLPLLGALSDHVPLGGRRWRPYLVAVGAAGAVTSAALAALAASPRSAAVLPLAMVRRVADAAQYLVAGAVMVVAARRAPLGVAGPLLMLRRTVCKVFQRLAWALAPTGVWASDMPSYVLAALLLSVTAAAAWLVEEAPPEGGSSKASGSSSSKAGGSSSSDQDVDESSGKVKHKAREGVLPWALPPTAAGVPWCYLLRTSLLLMVLQLSSLSARTIAQSSEMYAGFWMGLLGVGLYVACWRQADLQRLLGGCSWTWLGVGLLGLLPLVGVGGRGSLWVITLVRPMLTEVWMAAVLLLASSLCPVGWEATGYGVLALLWKATSTLASQQLVPQLLYSLDLPHIITTGRQWAALAGLLGLLVAPLLLKHWVPQGPDPWAAWNEQYGCSSSGSVASSRGSGGKQGEGGKVPAGDVLTEDEEAGIVLLSDAAPETDQAVAAARSK